MCIITSSFILGGFNLEVLDDQEQVQRNLTPGYLGTNVGDRYVRNFMTH